MKYRKLHLFLLTCLLLLGCEGEGLNPNEVTEPGFGGTMTFTGTIPFDSLYDLRVIAVPYYPIDTAFAEIFKKIFIEGVISFSNENFSNQTRQNGVINYLMFVKPQTYKYVAVVQQYGDNEFHDWRVVSVFGFSQTNPTHLPVIVEEDKITKNVNFIIDFHNLPPQPF